MSKIVHPYAHRLVMLRDWKSHWFADPKRYCDSVEIAQASDQRTARSMKRYQWPSSRLTEREMKFLYEQKLRCGMPITELIREAIELAYGKAVEEKSREKVKITSARQ